MPDLSNSPAHHFLKLSSPVEHVLLVELSRKPVNAFHEAFWTEYGQLFDNVLQDGDIRAVVLASSLSKIFTAGLDLNETSAVSSDPSEDPARTALHLRQHVLAFQSAISAVERCPVPVIAAVHGLAIGLAIDIITACDIRYAASDASFSIKEVDVGLAADIGTLARLRHTTANPSLARELALTARPFSASEALALGFISRVVQGGREEVLRAAIETAKEIASKSPVAVMGTKRLLLHARDHSVEENLEYTALWNGAMLQATDFREAITAFKTKKPPTFAPLPKLKGKL